MKNCCEEALYAEIFEGIDIESYVEMLEKNERCCHYEIDVAVRDWWCSPDYEIDRKFYKEVVDIIKPLLNNKIMETCGFEAFAYGGHYNAGVSLSLEYYINGQIDFEFEGDCLNVIAKLKEFVSDIDIESVLKNPPYYEM